MNEKLEKFKEAMSKDIFRKTKVINLEISNLCNYTIIHPQCPTSKMKKHIMPLETIDKISKNLGDANFNKTLSPYAYSEPLIDPRLYTVIEILRKNVPKARLAIITNGFFLYETILDDIVERGISHITVTAYFPNEHERINKLKEVCEKKYPKVFFRVIKGYPLQRRMADKYSIYDKDTPINKSKRGCRAPYRYVYINSYGDVVLCCNDWKAQVTFGNLKEKPVREIFLSDKMLERNLNAEAGNRQKYFLCSRCYRNK